MVLGNPNEFRERPPERLDSAFQYEVCRTDTSIKHGASQPKPRAHLVEKFHETLYSQRFVFLSAFDSARDVLPIDLRTARRVCLRELGKDVGRIADFANVPSIEFR